MHYYQFNIGDWALHTSHLTLEEEAVYRRILDFYYDTELPIPQDIKPVIRRLRLSQHSEIVDIILDEYFYLEDDGWHNKRVDEEIEKYQARSDRAKANGAKGGRPPTPKVVEHKANPKEPRDNPEITQWVNSANPEESKSKANEELRTKNEELRTKNEKPKDQKTMPTKADPPKDHELVFDYWALVMSKGQSTKPTPGRINKIKARLKEGYSVDDIKLAIDGCRQDPFSMGQNDRSKPYNDIELICRTGEKLESFIVNPVQLETTPVISAKDRERAEIIKARNEAMGISRPRDNRPFIEGGRL